jgi:hypothetical protein
VPDKCDDSLSSFKVTVSRYLSDMSESHSDFSLSRRRVLGLGVAAIPAAMLLGAGTAGARTASSAHPTTTVATGAGSVQLPAHSQVVYFC